ncbi:hypothetical protein CQW23_18530 [Capsicum baccatum]|uniref:FF domain-containing protein n=1 Tax=Capsicum baccatum TaxID=33114 RepID=A0A2G2W359_CAPBA|nr:hypothetical protein CQW23_18530 [Capsicum baccatum]
MRAVINDWRYDSLKSLCERKQDFNEYLSQKKKLEAEERRVKQKKAWEDFRIMLEEHAKALEEKKRNRVEYSEFLKSCVFIKASSQWRKVQDHLKTDERCSRLDKIDRLEIFQKPVCMIVDDILAVVGDIISCDGGIVISTDTIASTADGGGRSGDAGDSGSDGVRRICGMVVLVLIDELVGSMDRPIAVDSDSVAGKGVHGSIWVLHKMSGLRAKALVVLPCHVSLEVGQFVIAQLVTRRIMGDEGLVLEIFNKFVNELKEKDHKRQDDKDLWETNFYLSSRTGKKNFTNLSKSPHGHSKKVHPKKYGRDSSRDLRVPVLIRTIRILTKEKVQIASEVSSMLRNQVAERASAKEEANILQEKLDSQT